MFNKLRKMAKDNKGSEVVEKILMVIVSVILAGVGITYIYSVINKAIKDQNGDAGLEQEGTAPDGKPLPQQGA